MKCFAEKNGLCTILIDGKRAIIAKPEQCAKCSFFKTKRQFAKDRLRHFDKECESRRLTLAQASALYENLNTMICEE